MYNTCIVLVQYNDDTVHMVMLIYIYIIYSCTVHVQLLYSRSTLLNMASGLFLSNTELHEIYPSSSTDQVLYTCIYECASDFYTFIYKYFLQNLVSQM